MKTPRKVGLREAKAGLSRLVRDVQKGAEWLITDRGRPVARLVGVETDDLTIADRTRRLEATGVIAPRVREERGLSAPVPGGPWLQRFLREDRDAGR